MRLRDDIQDKVWNNTPRKQVEKDSCTNECVEDILLKKLQKKSAYVGSKIKLQKTRDGHKLPNL